MLEYPIVVSTDSYYMCFESDINNNIIKDEMELKETISRILSSNHVYSAGELLEIRSIVVYQGTLTVISYGIQYEGEEPEEFENEFIFKQFKL